MELIYKKNHKDYDKIRFVALATTKDSCRPILQILRMVDGTLTGCDGYRVHKSEIANIPNGLYEIEKLTKAKIIIKEIEDLDIDNYPCTSQFKPIVSSEDIVFKGKINLPNSTSFSAINAYCVVSNYCVNYDYLVDAIENTYEVTIYKISESPSPFLIETDLGEAVILSIELSSFKKANRI